MLSDVFFFSFTQHFELKVVTDGLIDFLSFSVITVHHKLLNTGRADINRRATTQLWGAVGIK